MTWWQSVNWVSELSRSLAGALFTLVDVKVKIFLVWRAKLPWSTRECQIHWSR